MLTLSIHPDAWAIAWQPRQFQKGEPIYYEGDAARTWYVVAEGVARTCRFHADGHRQLTGFHYSGDVFGLDEPIRQESAEAVTDVSLWCRVMDEASGLDARPEAAGSQSERALKKALDNANRCIFLFGRRTAPQRLAAFLLMTAGRLGAQEHVSLPMCRTDIADYLGLTIHTVSRAISQLCQDNLISLHGPQHFRLLDIAGLRLLAGEEEKVRIEAGEPVLDS